LELYPLKTVTVHETLLDARFEDKVYGDFQPFSRLDWDYDFIQHVAVKK